MGRGSQGTLTPGVIAAVCSCTHSHFGGEGVEGAQNKKGGKGKRDKGKKGWEKGKRGKKEKGKGIRERLEHEGC